LTAITLSLAQRNRDRRYRLSLPRRTVMQAEREYGRMVPHHLVQEFPAPLCRSCNVAMWVIKRDGENDSRLNRYGYSCRHCGEIWRPGREDPEGGGG